MSGLRRCAKCNKLIKVQDAGPEPMLSDGSFPKHYCADCKKGNELTPKLQAFEQLAKLVGYEGAITYEAERFRREALSGRKFDPKIDGEPLLRAIRVDEETIKRAKEKGLA